MTKPLDIVFIGLSLTSSWGNGHATTYRALLRGLARLGHRALFLERDVSWYAENRDLPRPDFCNLALYSDRAALIRDYGERIAGADAVIVGSFVPEGIAVIDEVLARAQGVRAFYDIDTPVTLARLERGDCDYLARHQIPALDAYLSFSGGEVLDVLADHFGAVAPHALYCAVDEDRYRPLDITKRWDLGYLGTYSDDRQPALERLLLEPARRLPHLRFVVAGPQYPAGIAWPANVERIEHVGPEDHAAFYAAQRHTLNVTRQDMIAAGWSPSVRLFEAAACGVPIISDRWRGLDELLPEDEAIVIADEAERVVAVLAEEPPREARERAARAREIILANHTGTNRAAQLLALLSGRAARRAAASPERPKASATAFDPRR
ncbi:spore maturation protein CgeB [Bosea sp. OAE506]|uniref:CgeB family protein n=1 Tax=Bosea sp. OAE506 TaxID=2663870 RepID=UPI00178A008F